MVEAYELARAGVAPGVYYLVPVALATVLAQQTCQHVTL